jgi:hypothetical protein
MFYMIDKMDILSIQCKMSLREPKSMREVDGLSLIFIDFYVPALTPRLEGTDLSADFCLSHIYRYHRQRDLHRH